MGQQKKCQELKMDYELKEIHLPPCVKSTCFFRAVFSNLLQIIIFGNNKLRYQKNFFFHHQIEFLVHNYFFQCLVL